MAQDTFLSFGLGFGVFLRVLSYHPPPRSVPGLVWVIFPFYRGPGHVSELLGSVLGCSCVFCPTDPPRSMPGLVWVI